MLLTVGRGDGVAYPQSTPAQELHLQFTQASDSIQTDGYYQLARRCCPCGRLA
jgi:hypothetical protein